MSLLIPNWSQFVWHKNTACLLSSRWALYTLMRPSRSVPDIIHQSIGTSQPKVFTFSISPTPQGHNSCLESLHRAPITSNKQTSTINKQTMQNKVSSKMPFENIWRQQCPLTMRAYCNALTNINRNNQTKKPMQQLKRNHVPRCPCSAGINFPKDDISLMRTLQRHSELNELMLSVDDLGIRVYWRKCFH